MYLHNTQQRAFYFPEWKDGDTIKAEQILIGPGESAPIDDAHFRAVLDAGGKGNKPLQALLDGRFLVYGDRPGDSRIQLENPTIEAPADMTSVEDERVERKTISKAEATIDLEDDGPAESSKSARNRKA